MRDLPYVAYVLLRDGTWVRPAFLIPYGHAVRLGEDQLRAMAEASLRFHYDQGEVVGIFDIRRPHDWDVAETILDLNYPPVTS